MVFVSLFCFVFISTSLSQRLSSEEVRAGTQVRNLEAEIDAEAMEERCLLTLSPRLVQFAFLYTSHLAIYKGPPAQRKMALSTMGWVMSQQPLIITVLHFLQTNLKETFSHCGSQVTLAFVSCHETSHHTMEQMNTNTTAIYLISKDNLKIIRFRYKFVTVDT